MKALARTVAPEQRGGGRKGVSLSTCARVMYMRVSRLLLFLRIACFPGQPVQFVWHQPFGEAGNECPKEQFRHVHRRLWLLSEEPQKGVVRRRFRWVKGRK